MKKQEETRQQELTAKSAEFKAMQAQQEIVSLLILGLILYWTIKPNIEIISVSFNVFDWFVIVDYINRVASGWIIKLISVHVHFFLWLFICGSWSISFHFDLLHFLN